MAQVQPKQNTTPEFQKCIEAFNAWKQANAERSEDAAAKKSHFNKMILECVDKDLKNVTSKLDDEDKKTEDHALSKRGPSVREILHNQFKKAEILYALCAELQAAEAEVKEGNDEGDYNAVGGGYSDEGEGYSDEGEMDHDEEKEEDNHVKPEAAENDSIEPKSHPDTEVPTYKTSSDDTVDNDNDNPFGDSCNPRNPCDPCDPFYNADAAELKTKRNTPTQEDASSTDYGTFSVTYNTTDQLSKIVEPAAVEQENTHHLNTSAPEPTPQEDDIGELKKTTSEKDDESKSEEKEKQEIKEQASPTQDLERKANPKTKSRSRGQRARERRAWSARHARYKVWAQAQSVAVN